jgi:hypothetical protein
VIGWKTDIVVSLGVGKRTAEISTIRRDGILICHLEGEQVETFYDLETGLLHRADPRGMFDGSGGVTTQPVEITRWAPVELEQLVAAFANPQVKADHLYQGLKASSVKLPPRIKLVRNYLGGVMVYQDAQRSSVEELIGFIMKGFDKE